MDNMLLKKMQEITPEERSYLEHNVEVEKSLYTTSKQFAIDKEMFLEAGKLITVRSHSRFIDFPEHEHNYIEIMYVCQGSITHYIDGKQLVMEQGDILFLNPYVRHALKKAGYDDLGINFIALPEFFDLPLQMLNENNVLAEFLIGTLRQSTMIPQYLLFKLKEEPAIENLMENMIRSLFYKRQDEDIMNQYSMGLVFLYLLQHMENLDQESSKDYKEVITQTVLKYIDYHYRTANLTKIANDCHRSISSISKIIKSYTGHTFQELLQWKRFQKAVVLLVETELPVEEIALAIGYENQSYFYSQFKSRYHMTPREYRMTHKHDTSIRL